MSRSLVYEAAIARPGCRWMGDVEGFCKLQLFLAHSALPSKREYGCRRPQISRVSVILTYREAHTFSRRICSTLWQSLHGRAQPYNSIMMT